MKKYVGVILSEAFILKKFWEGGEVGDANSIILKIHIFVHLVHLCITVMAMPMPIISPITTRAVVSSTLPVLEGGAEAHQDEL